MRSYSALSLLRYSLDPVPEDALRADAEWSWSPDVEIDTKRFVGYCPATGTEGGED